MTAVTGSRGPAPAFPQPHPCPAPGCRSIVSATRLLCRPHWHAVPKPLRDAVWRTWRSGAGAGSPEHQAAIADAVASVTGPSPAT